MNISTREENGTLFIEASGVVYDAYGRCIQH